jgi:hypothetical protein
MTRLEALSLFALAGIPVERVWALVDGYGYDPDDTRYFETLPRQVWWLAKTPFGLIQIGWRKRVIHIDWSETAVRRVITDEDVTKSETVVHAWSPAKAVEYLTSLRQALEDARNADAVAR